MQNVSSRMHDTACFTLESLSSVRSSPFFDSTKQMFAAFWKAPSTLIYIRVPPLYNKILPPKSRLRIGADDQLLFLSIFFKKITKEYFFDFLNDNWSVLDALSDLYQNQNPSFSIRYIVYIVYILYILYTIYMQQLLLCKIKLSILSSKVM